MGSVNGLNNPVDPIGSLEANFRHVVEYLMSHPEEKPAAPGRVGAFVARTGKLIKAHPFVAVGIGFGVGYAFMRLLRR